MKKKQWLPGIIVIVVIIGICFSSSRRLASDDLVLNTRDALPARSTTRSECERKCICLIITTVQKINPILMINWNTRKNFWK